MNTKDKKNTCKSFLWRNFGIILWLFIILAFFTIPSFREITLEYTNFYIKGKFEYLNH